ncbi:piggyBac transposable element-derived protein 3-like, partial [Rhagoletis pomonella]|uniref:piggyBac transposable element-derived protein 3-like n=1 Tax=Rhagoletis pomonella TaxID=28610 RepID=UPI00177AD256
MPSAGGFTGEIYLRARGIYSLGTIRVNRISNCKLPCDNIVKDKPRGFSAEFVGIAYGVEISNVLWKDNKSVRFASTYVGIEPFARANPNLQAKKATRYDRKGKKYIEVDCPQIIDEYNSHMGGVDKMDGLMGRYHIRAKTRDAMTRLFYHFIDMAATNSFILYQRIHNERLNDSNNVSVEEEKLLQLPEFREEIASGLVAYTQKRASGRKPTSCPSTSLTSTSKPGAISIGLKAKHPVDDVRFDEIDHFPIWLSKDGGKRKCKLCKTSQTQ